jgi:geranylgeranyl diphosphate synthase type I
MMVSSIQPVLLRHQVEIDAAIRRMVMRVSNTASHTKSARLQPYYGQIEYHMGWVNADFSPATSHPGKLLRPTLLLLAYEAAGAWGLADEDEANATNTDYLNRALPAAVAVELIHNFSLIHDDIEDRDTERRHRATLWKLWGIPQAINTGDGLFALARLALWGVLDAGVESVIAVRLGEVLDRSCLTLSEGQYLDINFEGNDDISVAMYVDMISRKTAALMRCAAEMGALLGTRDELTVDRLGSFGHAIGIAFQVRDDLLGIWASQDELGKTSAGDIYRRKKSLPILHALEHAGEDDQRFLLTLYTQETAITDEQVEAVLAIFARANTKAYCQRFLAEQCLLAQDALRSVPCSGGKVSTRALQDLEALIHFVEAAARE